MPKVKVQGRSSASPQDTFEKIKTLLDQDQDLRKLDPSYKTDFDAEKLSGSAVGGQFKAEMQVTEASPGTLVEITVDLPFHLGLVKGMIQKTLQSKLDKTLG